MAEGERYIHLLDDAASAESTDYVIIDNGTDTEKATVAMVRAGLLTVANNLSDLDDEATARTNLGLAIGTDVQAYQAAQDTAVWEAGTGTTESVVSPAKIAAAIVALATAAPNGAILPFAADDVPVGWLECNGAAISRTTYDDLFAVVGEVFGAGDGSTTFNLPDLRGEFIRGWADDRSVDTGRVFGSSQGDIFQGHYHERNGKTEGVIDNYASGSNAFAGGGAAYLLTDKVTAPITDGTNGTPRTGAETRPRNVALMYIIKY